MRRLPVVICATLSVALLACKSEPERVESGGAGKPAATADKVADPWGTAGAPKTPRPLITKPFLWRAEKDGQTTWLLGTMHLGVDAETQLPPWALDKLATMPAFVVEADVSDPFAITSALKRNDGGSLRTDLGPAHWKKLETAIGASLAKGFDGMRPFAVLSVLLSKDLPMTPPMDSVLLGRARTAGKKIHFLETVANQIAIIDPWMTAADIKAMLDHPEVASKSTRTLLTAYETGDAEALNKLFEDQTLWLAAGRKPETFPAYLDALLINRNRAWLPQIEKLHGEGGAFVAVGAGHLVGPGNLLDLMAARGFTIHRVGAP
jgi:hypothetical protein